MVFIYWTFSICVNQVTRFLDDPFIFYVDINYHDWKFHEPGYTICTDYANESFIEEYYQRYENVPIKYENQMFQDYRRYMKIIGSLNAETIHTIDQFENTTLFRNLSGEDLLAIAINV